MATKTTKATTATESTAQPLDDETRAKLEQAGFTVVRKPQREPRAPRTEKECRDHTTNFPDEEAVRPISEFGAATGSLCRRCYKIEQRAKRVEFRREHPTLQQWADELATFIGDVVAGHDIVSDEQQRQAAILLARDPRQHWAGTFGLGFSYAHWLHADLRLGTHVALEECA